MSNTLRIIYVSKCGLYLHFCVYSIVHNIKETGNFLQIKRSSLKLQTSKIVESISVKFVYIDQGLFVLQEIRSQL